MKESVDKGRLAGAVTLSARYGVVASLEAVGARDYPIILATILSLKKRDFVESAHAIGLPHRLIVFRHLIPNAMASVLVSATLMIGGLIGAEAGLSFLGIGVRPPTPSWGNMVSAGQDALLAAWWVAFSPGCLLAITILSFNLLADGLRDALDPKTLMRRYV